MEAGGLRMKKLGIKVLLTALSMIFAAATTSFAQQAPRGGTLDNGTGYEHPSGRGDVPSEEKRAEIRRRIEAVRIWKLTEALNLDASTSAKLASLLSSLDKQRMEIAHERMMTMGELRRLLKSPKLDERSLKVALDKLEQNHHAVQLLREKEISGLKDILTIEQQARYTLFQQEFQHEIRKMIAGARGWYGPEGGRTGNGPAGPPDSK
jgi:Spy/CpxP family protein refolding chaperone